ncbi:RusA family crossover junction endodeoxyribonuclease [Lentibacillus cibarius]|uniref:Uncharacterized protein n=1 Tax=Lentibacillus cibarius TaxID=2583219 RepID=A0A5S3QGB2_9BACI|nr:hypothetical protein [Lentibacillus cibarius]TMN20935.1 hypothetical protein FFL34_01535 [Lentibacillus cibarius]
MLQTHYINILKSLEMLKEETMVRLMEMQNDEPVERSLPENPLAASKPLVIDGYPVFQFSYAGMLPFNVEHDRDYFSSLQSYYQHVTFQAYNYASIDCQFGKSALLILHYFKDNVRRDLDNGNSKCIIDAIRYTRLIADDSWKELSLFQQGHPDSQNHIQAYLVEEQNLVSFLAYLQEHHNDLKHIPEVSNLDWCFEKSNKKEQAIVEENEVNIFW